MCHSHVRTNIGWWTCTAIGWCDLCHALLWNVVYTSRKEQRPFHLGQHDHLLVLLLTTVQWQGPRGVVSRELHLLRVAGAHVEYVDALMRGALLAEEHEEVQRELTQLLASLLTLLPQLRRLHLLVITPFHFPWCRGL